MNSKYNRRQTFQVCGRQTRLNREPHSVQELNSCRGNRRQVWKGLRGCIQHIKKQRAKIVLITTLSNNCLLHFHRPSKNPERTSWRGQHSHFQSHTPVWSPSLSQEAWGVSESATRLLLSSWRPFTSRNYDSAWNIWERWCPEHRGDPISLTVGVVEQTCLNNTGHWTATSVVSTVLGTTEGFTYPALKGAFQLHPPQPKYSAFWSAGKVLCHICSWEPNESLTLQKLSYVSSSMFCYWFESPIGEPGQVLSVTGSVLT